MCDLIQNVTLHWCECEISDTSYLMREKYNVQTNQKYHLKSLMLHFEGSFKLLKDTKINLVLMQWWYNAVCIIKSYAQSLPGNGEWCFCFWVCLTPSVLHKYAFCVTRDIQTSNEAVIYYDGSRHYTTLLWLDFVQGTACARMQSVCKVVMTLSACATLLKYLMAAAGSER